jgi:hypothetical protein
MGLLSRLPQAETWPELERAAEQRFWDGLTLATAAERDETGAVYFLGYVVEILLKTAFFRERGLSRHVDTSSERRVARKYARVYGAPRNDHDLNYWLLVLERIRWVNRRPLHPALLGALRLRVGIIADNWSESLRYREAQPTMSELHDVFANVEWVFRRRRDLWR